MPRSTSTWQARTRTPPSAYCSSVTSFSRAGRWTSESTGPRSRGLVPASSLPRSSIRRGSRSPSTCAGASITPQLREAFPTTKTVITHRLTITSDDQLDDTLAALLAEAYDTVGPGTRAR